MPVRKIQHHIISLKEVIKSEEYIFAQRFHFYKTALFPSLEEFAEACT